ncbi:hypothetical protein D3H55_23175 [Bacillus salacetis]|uniref:Uncharacterized protein n=1 Tax=Bacillus salacetis TaxID=2315464 RepID=A0A3A1QLM1_9BACI|nr:hypothetical protein [Bacillus salacetis]RIW27285.1 hypothetical protein D3H55_23175 [Bacillus salacetis]
MKKLLMFLAPAFFFVLFGGSADAATNQELEQLRNSGQDYEVELTYDQVVERTAELTGKSIEEVKKETPAPTFKAMSAKTMSATASSSNCGWYEVATSLNIGKSYKPTLIVIPSTCRSGSFGWIQEEVQPHLVGMKADGKKFEGQIEVRLQPSRFSYVVNGSWYNHGTVTHGGTTGASALWTATYSVSSSSSHYADWYSGVRYRQVF